MDGNFFPQKIPFNGTIYHQYIHFLLLLLLAFYLSIKFYVMRNHTFFFFFLGFKRSPSFCAKPYDIIY